MVHEPMTMLKAIMLKKTPVSMCVVSRVWQQSKQNVMMRRHGDPEIVEQILQKEDWSFGQSDRSLIKKFRPSPIIKE